MNPYPRTARPAGLVAAWVVLPLIFCSGAAAAQPGTPETASPPGPDATIRGDATGRIREEAVHRSQIMPILTYLSEAIGPRLTGSPAMKRANEWTAQQLTDWGLQNVRLEPWGPFSPGGWTLERFAAEVVEPQCIPLIAYPKAWSPGLGQPIVAPVVWVGAADAAALRRFHGRLKGAIVLNGPMPGVGPDFEPEATRKTDAELLGLANSPLPAPVPSPSPAAPLGAGPPALSPADRMSFFVEEGAALVVDPSSPVAGTSLHVEVVDPTRALAEQPHLPDSADFAQLVPQIVVAPEQYNRMVRMIQLGGALRMRVELRVHFDPMATVAYNTIGEIPGSDLKEQVVMLGGHLDSWHSGTGATDNAAGAAACMEAVRILRALDLKPRRTIRIALWSGEEEGLMGSRSYVAKHFGAAGGGPGAGQRTPEQQAEYQNLSAYYNLDAGSGRIRGVYLEENEALRPIFRSWLAPFADLGASTLAFRGVYGSDERSFDDSGLPGIPFIQDDLDYWTRVHHTNQDLLEHVIPADLEQAAAILADVVYQTAMRNERLPRKLITSSAR